ncbi:hypothetical protein DFH06DRAFT_1446301 [Mycena polygramma]|nr:hypothetical protein DFH06DRAFT_1446301 [Mycena polygramma]
MPPNFLIASTAKRQEQTLGRTQWRRDFYRLSNCSGRRSYEDGIMIAKKPKSQIYSGANGQSRRDLFVYKTVAGDSGQNNSTEPESDLSRLRGRAHVKVWCNIPRVPAVVTDRSVSARRNIEGRSPLHHQLWFDGLRASVMRFVASDAGTPISRNTPYLAPLTGLRWTSAYLSGMQQTPFWSRPGFSTCTVGEQVGSLPRETLPQMGTRTSVSWSNEVALEVEEQRSL